MRYIVFCAALILAVSGCGQEPSGEGVATVGGVAVQQSADPDRPSDDPEERVRQFVTCMRANGVDLPDPQPGDTTGKSALRFDSAGADKTKLVAATEKCQRYLPPGGVKANLTPDDIEKIRRFSQCMRENGVPTWPDPLPDGSFDGDALITINKDDPGIRAVMDRCRAA